METTKARSKAKQNELNETTNNMYINKMNMWKPIHAHNPTICTKKNTTFTPIF